MLIPGAFYLSVGYVRPKHSIGTWPIGTKFFSRSQSSAFAMHAAWKSPVEVNPEDFKNFILINKMTKLEKVIYGL
jgi:hypothetical protein